MGVELEDHPRQGSSRSRLENDTNRKIDQMWGNVVASHQFGGERLQFQTLAGCREDCVERSRNCERRQESDAAALKIGLVSTDFAKPRVGEGLRADHCRSIRYVNPARVFLPDGMLAPVADPNIGREIANQFRIVQKIGSGGMGAVYKAEQPDMRRFVAIKILHPRYLSRPDLVSRFRREARAMSHLAHPNTAKVFLYGQLEDGACYFVMEYLEGRNLAQTVRAEGPMETARAIHVMTQVCGALEEAHSKGIVHRDLKPENIFLTNLGGIEDFPKVLDFGLAKVTEREMRPGSLILTQEGMIFGTPEFMSPEQARGEILDSRSDIYSLGVILYELLTGKLPFDAANPMEFVQKHIKETPMPLSRRAPNREFPPGLWEVIARALAKDPAQRFQSANEFGKALKDAIQPKERAPYVSPAQSPFGATRPGFNPTPYPQQGVPPTVHGPPLTQHGYSSPEYSNQRGFAHGANGGVPSNASQETASSGHSNQSGNLNVGHGVIAHAGLDPAGHPRHAPAQQSHGAPGGQPYGPPSSRPPPSFSPGQASPAHGYPPGVHPGDASGPYPAIPQSLPSAQIVSAQAPIGVVHAQSGQTPLTNSAHPSYQPPPSQTQWLVLGIGALLAVIGTAALLAAAMMLRHP